MSALLLVAWSWALRRRWSAPAASRRFPAGGMPPHAAGAGPCARARAR